MISVAEAEKIILQNASPSGEETVPLAESLGRVLAEDLIADRDFPPFDRATMDGIALNFNDLRNGNRNFRIIGVQAAGSEKLELAELAKKLETNSGQPFCIEIMTGAMLPGGTDTVIRYEDLLILNPNEETFSDSGGAALGRSAAIFTTAKVLSEKIERGQNIHQQGIDRKKGEVVVRRGLKISPAEIGTAATVGKAEIRVTKLPKVAVVSTGDELVKVSETPLPHQIRMSNSLSISALLTERFGIRPEVSHFPDEEGAIRSELPKLLKTNDLVILSGAVSEGKFDFLPKVMESSGVKKLFHKVAQRPGKPFWFGRQKELGPVVFALPGNPVSAFMCTCRYVLPFLEKCLGLPETAVQKAMLSEDFFFKPALTYFLTVKTSQNLEGQFVASPLPGHGSGDLANLNDADAFLELPADRDTFSGGEFFPIWKWRFGRSHDLRGR